MVNDPKFAAICCQLQSGERAMFKMDAGSGCQVHSEWNSLKWKKKYYSIPSAQCMFTSPTCNASPIKLVRSIWNVAVCVCVCDGGESGWTGVCFKIYKTLKLKHNVMRKIPKPDICSFG